MTAIPTPRSDSATQRAARDRVVAEIARGVVSSRAQVSRHSGLARSTVGQQIDFLISVGLIREDGVTDSARGRPARKLSIDPRAGSIAVADIDTQETRLAIADLSGNILESGTLDLPIDRGPASILEAVSEALLELASRSVGGPIRQVVVAVPGPVDFRRGVVVRPPIMPGWDGYPIGEDLERRLRAPTIVDNDVNVAAIAEATQPYAALPLLVLKVDAGIGAGIIIGDRTVLHGADGAAGDIGHIRVTDDETPCSCGKSGCLEAVASFSVVLRQLGIAHSTSQEYGTGIDVLRARLLNGDAEAMRTIRTAGEQIGEVAASMIQMFNPRTLVLSGAFSERHDELLSGVRAVVYQRSVPLATRELTLTTSQLGDAAEILGGVELGLQQILQPAGVRRVIAELISERSAATS